MQLGTSTEKQVIKKGSNLRSLWSSTKYARVPNIRRGAEIPGNSLDLLSQFPRGSENQSDGAFATSQSFLIVNVHSGRKYILQIQQCQNETEICQTKESPKCYFMYLMFR